VSWQAAAWVERYSPYKGATFQVHKALGEIVNEERGYQFYGTLTRLARKTRIGRKSIGEAIVVLTDAGFLECLRPPVDGQGRPTGKTGIYRFLFPGGLPVIYDGQGGELLDDPDEGGASKDSPRSKRESHGGFSADQRAESGQQDDPSERGASNDARPQAAPGESSDAPGASIHAGGASDDARIRRELEAEQEASRSLAAAAEAATASEVLRAPREAIDVSSLFEDDAPPATTSARTPARRAPDPVWDALTSAYRIDTSTLTATERARLNAAVKQLRDAGADPTEIPQRAAAYRHLFPNAAFTPMALVGRWSECEPGRVVDLLTTEIASDDPNQRAIATARRQRQEGTQ